MFPQYSDQEYVQPNNKATGFIAIHEVLSARFLDTVSYTPDPSVIIGGAWGCMRFEHVLTMHSKLICTLSGTFIFGMP